MAIRWDKFTLKAQEAVQRANELASEHGNPELLPLHLLAALLEDKEGIVPPVLEKIGIGPQVVLNEIYQEMDRLPKVSGGAAQAALSQTANQLLDRAFKEADNFKDEYVSAEHLLLAMALNEATDKNARNNEVQTLYIEGRARPQDIGANNSILSNRLADAKISYTGDGLLADKQRPGVLTRFLSWLRIL